MLFFFFQCKHAGKPRIRGNAQGPVQQYLASCCEAVISNTGEQYVVTKLSTDHNHIISSSTLGMYSSNRRLSDEEIEEIKPFLDMKVSAIEIKSYLTTKTGKQVQTKDIINVKKGKSRTTELQDSRISFFRYVKSIC